MARSDYIEYDATLTPCPFCGGTEQKVMASHIMFEDQEWYWSVECKDCRASVSGFHTERQAIDAWERRFAKDDIEEDGYITWKRYRQRFCDELTERIESR